MSDAQNPGQTPTVASAVVRGPRAEWWPEGVADDREADMAARTVLVRCGDCGDQRVALPTVTLRHCVDDDTWAYRARCPSCRMLVADRTSRRAALAAVEWGASLEQWHHPAELAERPRDAPRFTLDDLVAFRRLLQRDDGTTALGA